MEHIPSVYDMDAAETSVAQTQHERYHDDKALRQTDLSGHIDHVSLTGFGLHKVASGILLVVPSNHKVRPVIARANSGRHSQIIAGLTVTHQLLNILQRPCVRS